MEYSECLVNVTFHFFVQYFLLLIIVFPISTKSFPKTIHVKGLVKDFLPCKQRMLTECCILLIYQLMDSARLTAYHKPLHTKVTHLTFLLKPQQSTEKREKRFYLIGFLKVEICHAVSVKSELTYFFNYQTSSLLV